MKTIRLFMAAIGAAFFMHIIGEAAASSVQERDRQVALSNLPAPTFEAFTEMTFDTSNVTSINANSVTYTDPDIECWDVEIELAKGDLAQVSECISTHTRKWGTLHMNPDRTFSVEWEN